MLSIDLCFCSKIGSLEFVLMDKPRSLVDQIYEQLRSDIISGRIASSEKLVELEIAERMGTSQGTVREALQRLECDGLVDRQARRATYVTQIALDQIYEYFSVRSLIESFTIRRAMQNITNAQCQQLEALIVRMAEAGEQNDIETLVQHDMHFHQSLCVWAESPVLMNVWLPLFLQIQRFIVQTHPKVFVPLSDMAETHRPIMLAIHARDSEAASLAIQEHVMLIWKRIDHHSLTR
jgi:DNA-binding GntR family transcriptional regulator